MSRSSVCDSLLQHLHLCHSLPPTFPIPRYVLSSPCTLQSVSIATLHLINNWTNLEHISSTQICGVRSWVGDWKQQSKGMVLLIFLTASWLLCSSKAYLDFFLVDLLSPCNTQGRRQGIVAPWKSKFVKY